MVRRIASQVHKQVGRLLRTEYLEEQPLWLSCVLAHPPLPLPSKTPSRRTAYDTPRPASSSSTKLRAIPVQPQSISYLEDDLRRQFFRDHPFEAFRAKTLVESNEIQAPHSIQGLAWSRLRQHGRNPSAEECVLFAVNLYQHHNTPISMAYSQSVGQFRALRSEHAVASSIAAAEAEFYGSKFGRTEIARGHEKETAKLGSFQRQAEMDEGEMIARKRWRAIAERSPGIEGWSKGQEYVRLWKSGVRPTYAAAITTPVEAAVTLAEQASAEALMRDQVGQSADFIGVLAGKR